MPELVEVIRDQCNHPYFWLSDWYKNMMMILSTMWPLSTGSFGHRKTSIKRFTLKWKMSLKKLVAAKVNKLVCTYPKYLLRVSIPYAYDLRYSYFRPWSIFSVITIWQTKLTIGLTNLWIIVLNATNVLQSTDFEIFRKSCKNQSYIYFLFNKLVSYSYLA